MGAVFLVVVVRQLLLLLLPPPLPLPVVLLVELLLLLLQRVSASCPACVIFDAACVPVSQPSVVRIPGWTLKSMCVPVIVKQHFFKIRG